MPFSTRRLRSTASMLALLAVMLQHGCRHDHAAGGPGEQAASQGAQHAAGGTPAPLNGASNLAFEGSLPPQGGRPVGWSGGGEGYDLSVDSGVLHSGRASGHIARRADAPAGAHDFASLTQCVEPTEWRGHRVRLSGWVRTRDAGWAGLWMRVDGPQNKSLAFDNMESRALKGTTGWTRCEVVLDVPREAIRVCFGMLLSGAGEAWVDDVAVEFVGTDVPTTGKSAAP